ncbi:MAG: hypothetical protein ACT4OI_00385 [Methanobacteriota archaeon]
MILAPASTRAADEAPGSTSISSTSSGWSKAYGTTAYEQATAVRQTPDGGFVVAAHANSGDWLFKLDPGGTLTWQKDFGTGSVGWPRDTLEVLPDGGYVLVGHNAAANQDGQVIRLDAVGSVLWKKIYGGASRDGFHSVAVTADGGFVVGGGTASFGAGDDFWIVKLDSNGAVQWERAVAVGSGALARLVAPTSDGGYLAVGHVSLGTPFPGYNAVAVKLDGQGSLLWSRRIDAKTASRFWTAVPTPDGGFLAGGELGGVFLARFDATGSLTWKRTYGSGSVWGLAATSDGGFVASGGLTVSVSHGGKGGSSIREDRDAYLLRVDGDGNLVWMRTYGVPTTQILAEWGSSVQQTTDGGYVMAGQTYGFGAGSADAWVLRLDGNGLVGSSCPSGIGAARSVSVASPNATITALTPSLAASAAGIADIAVTPPDYTAVTSTQCVA